MCPGLRGAAESFVRVWWVFSYQGFLRISQTSEVRYDAHESSPLVPIVTQIEPIWHHVIMFAPDCIIYCLHVV